MTSSYYKLTPAQRDVLCRLGRGYSRKEIAFQRGSSNRTIDFHMNSIFIRLKVNTTLEALLTTGIVVYTGPK